VVKTVLLDGGPLGLVTNPKRSPISLACTRWLQALITAGNRVIIPEIVDYELRRELIRAKKPVGIAQLDALSQLLEYLPIHTSAMRRAAEGERARQGRHDRFHATSRSRVAACDGSRTRMTFRSESTV